jgi:hypothetical protein
LIQFHLVLVGEDEIIGLGIDPKYPEGKRLEPVSEADK